MGSDRQLVVRLASYHSQKAVQVANGRLLGVQVFHVLGQYRIVSRFALCRLAEFTNPSSFTRTISSNDTGFVNCQSLYLFNQFMGNFAIGSASTLLMLRTIAIYSKNLYVVVPLVVLSLAQWGILLHGISTVQATWVDLPTGGGSCVVTGAPQVFLQLLYIYS